jgi:hypothetical protein
MNRKNEILLTKELARRLQTKFPDLRVYANKCPSRSSKIKKLWLKRFHNDCPPLQPEMDIIFYDPLPNPKIRAFEIKYFTKLDGKINQSFYKGIEQASALIQWGFDNVALWQLFDETFSDDDLRNYGGRTWRYIQGVLKLPIGFTMIRLIGKNLKTLRFQVVQPDWNNDLTPINKRDIDDPKFPFSHRPLNPLIYGKILNNTLKEEVIFLRNFLLEWLPTKPQGMS